MAPRRRHQRQGMHEAAPCPGLPRRISRVCRAGRPHLAWFRYRFVLAGEASVGLERKQRAKYGGQPEYEAWVKGSWAGPVFDPKKAE